jgi:transposase InsO family protein
LRLVRLLPWLALTGLVEEVLAVLQEVAVAEQRYRAVLEVLEGGTVTEVARRFGVSRQTVHVWLRRYAADGGVTNLVDRSSRPGSCPHQMNPHVEAKVLVIRDLHPTWGADRIRYQLQREAVEPVPGRTSIYRALVRNGRVDPRLRKRRRSDYRRWERGRPMELWQMDVVGGIHLADGVEVKCVTGIDDNSRFVVSARLVARATARPVCEALLAALRAHGIPEGVLTDNGKVFTGRFGAGGLASEVLFDRICAENGIRHLLTAPRSPTTTGKVERLHKTMRAEFLTAADRQYPTIAALQLALDTWVVHYNTERPHQALGMRPPVERFALAGQPTDDLEAVVDPRPLLSSQPDAGVPPLPRAGVQRWVDVGGKVRLAGFSYRVPITLAGEPVQCVVAGNLVEIYHHEVLVASHVQHRHPGDKHAAVKPPVQGMRRGRKATEGPVVTRIADNNGAVSFAGTLYRAGRAWRGQSLQVCIVAGSVELTHDGTLVKVHPIRHDRTKEHAAFASPNGHPRKHRQDAPDGAGVKATPLRGRPDGRALTPPPGSGANSSGAGMMVAEAGPAQDEVGMPTSSVKI